MKSTVAEIIKSRVTSRQLLEHVGVPVLKNGFACCPLHGEKTPSLKVYADPQRGWHCFGCGRGGTVIDLCMAETAYWVAFDAWIRNERILDEQAPASPEDPMSEDFADAAVHKSEIEDALELAEEEWRIARDELWA